MKLKQQIISKMQKITFYIYHYFFLLLLIVIGLPVHAEDSVSDIFNITGQAKILPVNQTCAGDPWQHIVWVHVHDNEETARQAALLTLNQIKQGCLVDFRHDGSREISIQTAEVSYHFDPNRIFTESGRNNALKCRRGNCAGAREELGQEVRSFLDQYLIHAKLIVALHNNHPRGLSIRNYVPGGSMAQAISQVSVSPDKDPHDFFYVTSRQAFDFLSGRNFNVVLQNNQDVHDDGSLSVWAARQQIDYINAEGRTGNLISQMAMLSAVQAYMQQYYY